jgi:hypothetical protein
MATPAQVRNKLKKAGTPYGIFKTTSCWFVIGGKSDEWQSTSLNLYKFDELTDEEVLEMVIDLEKDNAPDKMS